MPLALLQAVAEVSEELLRLLTIYKPPSFSTRPAFSLTRVHLQARPYATGGLRGLFYRSGGAPSMLGLSGTRGARQGPGGRAGGTPGPSCPAGSVGQGLAVLQQAGDKALARSAHREAVGYFEQALSALPHLPETRDTREQAIDLWLALRSALQTSGDHARIPTCLHEAEAIAVALNDQRRLGRVSVFLSSHFHLMVCMTRPSPPPSVPSALATADGDVVRHALANQFLGTAYEFQGDYRRAIDCFSQVVASLTGCGIVSVSVKSTCPP